MIKVYGTVGCKRCNKAKFILEESDIKYEYIMLGDELSKEEREKIIKLAQNNGVYQYPIIIESKNNILKLSELLDKIERRE